MLVKKLSLLIVWLVLIAVLFIAKSSLVLAASCSSTLGPPGGGGGAVQGNGVNGQSGATTCGSSGGGGGGSAAGGNGGNGAGGGVLLKNTSGAMTISGTIDNRGGGGSSTNGGTVKLFYTGTAPSTGGISSGRTYSSLAAGANTAPAAPTLLSPASGITGTSTSPLLQLKSTDADSDYLIYKILLYNSDCSTGLQTYDQTSSQVGWSGQDLQAGTAYSSGSVIGSSTAASYGLANLSANTQYCWKAEAIDPGGSNTFSSFSSTQLFTTGPVNPGVVNINGGTNITGGSIVR